MIDISALELNIPFRSAFKHARAERERTQSIIVTAKRNDNVGGGEACPRKYVTGENVLSCLQWINDNKASIAAHCIDLNGLMDWMNNHRNSIGKNPSAWCAVELALLDLFAIEKNLSVEELLSLDSSAGTYQYTAVIGDSNDIEFNNVLSKYSGFGFRDYKLKISGNTESDKIKIKKIKESTDNVRIRLDANNLWASEYEKARAYLANIDQNVFAIEEPLAVRDFKGMERLAEKFSMPVIFDESVCNSEDLKQIALIPENCIINVRISKMGGLLTSLQIIDEIKQFGFKVIVGCMVGETSILSRAALIATKYSGELLVAQEGAFGQLLLAYDYVRPTIQFGAKGIFRFNEPKRTEQSWKPGWGLEFTKPQTGGSLASISACLPFSQTMEI